MNSSESELPFAVTKRIDELRSRLRPWSADVAAAYITGSHAYGAAVRNSDVDVVLVTRGGNIDKGLGAFAADVSEEHNTPAGVPLLDVLVVSEQDLSIPPDASAEEAALHRKVVLSVALKSQLLWGEDVRDRIDVPKAEAYTRQTTEVPWLWIRRFRQSPDLDTTARLGYPDPKGEFFGYFGQDVPPNNSVKSMLSLYTWFGTVALAHRSGEMVFSKSQVAKRYAEEGLWRHEHLTNVLETVRNDWNYQLPTDETGRQVARGFAAELVSWERQFQRAYVERDFSQWIADTSSVSSHGRVVEGRN